MSGYVEKTVDLTDEQTALVYLFASELAESGCVIQAAAAVIGYAQTKGGERP